MKNLITLFICGITSLTYSQDLIELKIGGSIDTTNKFQETFSLNFNRTEAFNSEAKNTYAICDGNCSWLFKPSTSINLGGGTTSAVNNIIAQGNFIYLLKPSSPKLKTVDNKSISKNTQRKLDFNATYESDKDFRERLFYGQFKFNWNPIRTKVTGDLNTSSKKRITGFMFNPYFNIGARNSRDFQSWNLYAVGGLHLEWFYRFGSTTKESADQKFQLKLAGDGLYVINESDLYSQLDPFRYAASAAFEVKANEKITIGIKGELGTITPKYESYKNIQFTLLFDPF